MAVGVLSRLQARNRQERQRGRPRPGHAVSNSAQALHEQPEFEVGSAGFCDVYGRPTSASYVSAVSRGTRRTEVSFTNWLLSRPSKHHRIQSPSLRILAKLNGRSPGFR